MYPNFGKLPGLKIKNEGYPITKNIFENMFFKKKVELARVKFSAELDKIYCTVTPSVSVSSPTVCLSATILIFETIRTYDN